MSRKRSSTAIAEDIQAAANEYTDLRQRMSVLEQRIESGQTADRIAAASTELAQCRERESEITARMEKLKGELAQAREREAREQAEARAAKAPALRQAVQRHREADARIDAALAELEAAWNEGDAAADEIRTLAGGDATTALNRLRSGRPLIQAMKGIQTRGVPLTQRLEINAGRMPAVAFSASTAPLLDSIEKLADTYESETEEA